MNIINSQQRDLIIANAPSNKNQVIIFNGLWGCLKVLANSDKYFNVYYPEFTYIDWKMNKSKITQKALKESFIRLIDRYDSKDKILTRNEIKELAKYFKINLEKNYPQLAESKTCQRVKGFKKPSTNKRVKTYARKRK